MRKKKNKKSRTRTKTSGSSRSKSKFKLKKIEDKPRVVKKELPIKLMPDPSYEEVGIVNEINFAKLEKEGLILDKATLSILS